MGRRGFVAAIAISVLAVGALLGAPRPRAEPSPIDSWAHDALSGDPARRLAGIEALAASQDRGAVAPLIQLLRWVPEEGPILAALHRLTGADAGAGWADWMLWQQAHPEFPAYAGYDGFLADLLASIDPAFRRFIAPGVGHEIRLEEIAWGGVRVDGIPALDRPEMTAAESATYLEPTDLVFGVEIAGDARAYPLRIANWHEMVNDTVGGVPVSLAYCTLCGAGILYDDRVPGHEQPFSFGTSGLLYRSNKLMYDRQTHSLWNQFTGRPAVGPLVGSGIELKMLPLVVARWEAWRAAHPDTRVMSLHTGYARDYDPDAAYGAYFSSPDLMFPAVVTDRRLQRKDIVFGLRVVGGAKAWPLARFAAGAVVNDRVGLVEVVLIGDADGRTVRAYERRRHSFEAASEGRLRDDGGRIWHIEEDALLAEDGTRLPRIPGHLAYWFAWSGYFEAAELGTSEP
jgi:hypothetical protein